MKNTMEQYKRLPQALLGWYYAHRRELPWRQDREPYRVWLSEIMLQQTRVEAVKGYYSRFLQTLPTVGDLADADEELLYKLWEGLGYYSRVRNLKKAAQIIMRQHGGEFPRTYEAVMALPGIGAYTAGAVCSIAFDLPTPAVDGNVLRVISRLTDDATPVDLPSFKASVRRELERVYPKEAGDFTQALMELGATVCGPNREPDCGNCPCQAFCLGFARGTARSLPVKQPKKKRRVEEMTVFILSCRGAYALQKRDPQGLLAGMWQFPNAPAKLTADQAVAYVEQNGLKPKDIMRQVERKHIFTHVEWDMSGVYMETAEMGGEYTWLSAEQLRTQTALPTAFRQFWEEIDSV